MTIRPIVPLIIMAIIVLFLTIITIINKKHLVVRILMIALLFLVNIRPVKLNSKQETYRTDLDILFVVDTTMSMGAIDISNTRMEKAIKDMNRIMNKFAGSNFALITFGKVATIISPFTFDNKKIVTAINNLKPGQIIYAQGTSIDQPLETMKLLLETSSERENNQTVLIFITDGEFNKNNDISGYRNLSQYISNGIVIGYGTTQGGKIKANTDGLGYQTSRVNEEGFVVDTSKYPYEPAISKLDETNLTNLANTLNIQYINASDTNKLDNKLNDIQSGIVYHEVDSESGKEDYYYLFSIPLLGLFIYEFIIYRREL